MPPAKHNLQDVRNRKMWNDNDTDLFQPAFVVLAWSEWCYPYYTCFHLRTGMLIMLNVLIRCNCLGWEPLKVMLTELRNGGN
jgi:hypothetical protein